MRTEKVPVLAVLCVATPVFVTACTDNTRVAGPLVSQDAAASASAVGMAVRYVRVPERPMEDIAAAAPSFGGYFLEGGNIVAYTTDVSRANAVTAAVESVVRKHYGAPTSERRVLIRQGHFSFSQLREWRDLATDDVLSLPDAVWVDLDEGRNRLAVGLATGAQPGIARRLTELGIPREAAIFEVTGRMIVDVDSLTHRRRPLDGGLQIDPGGNGPDYCTFGFSAVWNGQNVFVTNSHCTFDFWRDDGRPFYQNVEGQGNRIGHEVYDPLPFRCGPFWDRDDCRYSDAAIILDETDSLNFGYIAKTMWFSFGTGNHGSLEIDSTFPRMPIIAERVPEQYDLVYKMGRTTGWTSGWVMGSCVDYEELDRKLICQYFANYARGGGDSGSPVFLYHVYNVTLVGIHRGFLDQDGRVVFSPISGVEQDLGPLTTFPQQPPPLTVTMSGPGAGMPYEWVIVTANVSNYVPPVTYEWTVNQSPACGNENTCGAYLGAAGTYTDFAVTVTDAAPATAYGYLSVFACTDGCEPESPRLPSASIALRRPDSTAGKMLMLEPQVRLGRPTKR